LLTDIYVSMLLEADLFWLYMNVL